MPKKPSENTKHLSRRCPFDGLSCVYPCSKLVHGRMDAGCTDDAVIKKLGLTRSTWWRYRRGQQCPPLSVCGYLSALSGVFPWTDWREFNINPGNGKLFHRDLKHGWTPHEIVWLRSQYDFYRDESSRLKIRLERLTAKVTPAVSTNVLKFTPWGSEINYEPAA